MSTRQRPRIAIVGGGPGGLMTAYSLQRIASVPFELTIFEAGTRLGGKIQTKRFQHAACPYEAGAAEIYDYSHHDEDPLRELIAELGLDVVPMGGSSLITNNRVIANIDDLREQFGNSSANALLRFDREAKDAITPREYYAADELTQPNPQFVGQRFDQLLDSIRDAAARRYVEQLIHSDLATEGCQTSVSYGLQNYLMNDSAYMRLYGIVGGNERLPQALASRIAAQIHFERTVTRVERSENGRLRVFTRNTSHVAASADSHSTAAQADEFDFVVLALPIAPLQQIAFGGERLQAALRRHFEQFDHPAHYLRVTILIDRPFWRDRVQDSYWMLDEFNGCCLYDESSRTPGMEHGVLGWLLGGEAACEFNAFDDQALVERVLDCLPPVLGNGRAHFLEAQVHRWLNTVSALPGGHEPWPHDRRHQPEPVDHPRLFVVGDYLFDSTLNGVLDSALYVADWLASTLCPDEMNGPAAGA